jgi:putative membrane protein
MLNRVATHALSGTPLAGSERQGIMYSWYYGSFFGMHFFWWVFWFVMIVVLFSLATPVPRRRMRLYEHPLSILQRRYAAGDITTEEYEERKAHIQKDVKDVRSSAIP